MQRERGARNGILALFEIAIMTRVGCFLVMRFLVVAAYEVYVANWLAFR